MTTAVAFGSLGRKRGTMKAKPSRLMTKLAIIAEISLQALMRHQYQRRIRTSPVPAPSARRSSHAFSMEASWDVTAIEARKRRTVAARDTAT